MKKVLGLIVIIPVLLQAMTFSVIYSGYLLNKVYISTNLCENRTVPEKHCEGKCVLKKEMKTEAEKENSVPASVKKGSEVVYFFSEELKISAATLNSDYKYIVSTESYRYSITSGIFHPPRA